MYLDNNFIASLPLNRKLVTFPGYIGWRKRHLLRLHKGAIGKSLVEPDFYVVYKAGLRVNLMENKGLE
jgi:hypothetical protein